MRGSVIPITTTMTYTNVVKTEETKYNGHKTLIITFKEAEEYRQNVLLHFKVLLTNTTVLYAATVTNYDELIKITEKAEVEPDLESAIPTRRGGGTDDHP